MREASLSLLPHTFITFSSAFRTTIIALLAVAQLSSTVTAFGIHGGCGSTQEPSAANKQGIANAVQKYHKTQSGKKAAAPIPVTFHVILPDNNGGAANVTDETLEEQIRVFNGNFEGSGVSFELSAITRTVNSYYFNAPYWDAQARDDIFKELRRGSALDLNFFTVSLDPPPEGQSQVLGFSSFPWEYETRPDVDGVVFDYRALPGGEFGPLYNTGKIGVHELGHWVGLLHTFQGGCEGDGDSVGDTLAEAKANTGCPAESERPDSCPDQTDLDPIYNHMDYTNDECRREFTRGQVERFQSMLSYYRGVVF